MLEIRIHIVAIKQKAKTRTHHTQTAINKLDACEKENANVRQRVDLAAQPAETNSTSEGKLIGKSNRRRSNGVWPAGRPTGLWTRRPSGPGLAGRPVPPEVGGRGGRGERRGPTDARVPSSLSPPARTEGKDMCVDACDSGHRCALPAPQPHASTPEKGDSGVAL